MNWKNVWEETPPPDTQVLVKMNRTDVLGQYAVAEYHHTYTDLAGRKYYEWIVGRKTLNPRPIRKVDHSLHLINGHTSRIKL
jgi:hypothetical protein